jgi:hypothetical protein
VRAILGECPGHFKRGDVSLDWALISTYKEGRTWTMDNSVEGNVRATVIVMDSSVQCGLVLRNFEFRPSDLTGLFEDFEWLIIRALFFIVDLRLCVTRYEGRFTSIIIIIFT